MFALSTIFSLLVAVAGWHYAFYSSAAARLGAIESAPTNRLRVRLRRANGLMMCAMAVCIFLGAASLENRWSAAATVVLWFAVMVLLFGIAILVLVDVRLTNQLRRQMRQRRDKEEPK